MSAWWGSVARQVLELHPRASYAGLAKLPVDLRKSARLEEEDEG
jgi:hypothetical protein